MILPSATSRAVYASGGIVAIAGFFLPWMTFQTIGMPDRTVTISTWSGWSNPLLMLGFLALAIAVVAVIVAVMGEPLHALWIRSMTVLGLLILMSVTYLLLPDDQAAPAGGPPPQFDYGLILTYSGYAGMIIGSFVLARQPRKALGVL